MVLLRVAAAAAASDEFAVVAHVSDDRGTDDVTETTKPTLYIQMVDNFLQRLLPFEMQQPPLLFVDPS